jgi:predicted alpha-1,2-mannosidase
MTKTLFVILNLWCFVGISQIINYETYVNPFVGTGGHGHTFPGATVPFGMVQLSPDTRIDGSWDGCSGYHYSDSIIYGFSHTHLNGTGCSDYGDILFMPFTGTTTTDSKKYASLFSHNNEKATAGYYSVKLTNGVDVELTSTTRVGLHRYTFPQNKAAHVILDLTHRDKTLDSYVKITGPRTIEGFRRSEAWAKDQYIYFVAEFSEDFTVETFVNNTILKDQKDNYYNGQNVKAIFTFANTKKVVLLKVGISTVSVEGAKKNMQAELPDWDFNKTKSNAEALWNKELAKIEIGSSDIEKLTIFYTALYHTMMQPNVAMDVDGLYRGRDNQIHKAEGFTYYSVFSLWDTFRGAHPLYTIIEQKRTSDFINTFLAQYEQGGRLPVWELASNETDCMIGYHSVSVIADAMAKGIKGFDYNKAFEASKHSAMLDHLGLQAYKQNGVITMDDEQECVSKTVEYAYDDWCIAQMAKILNKTTDYDYFMKRSQNWKNTFDPVTGFMRPKKNGGWLNPFDAKEVNNNFTEGNSWQYTFFVPQDVYGLVDRMGGVENFEKKLDELFTTNSKTTGREQADITGLIGQYAHGNEPSHHMAYLYNYVGNPFKTQKRVRQILSNFYKNSPDGLIGNEDCGQMSAWYVLSSMGFYPVCPGSVNYELGSPIFPSCTIHLENGKSINLFTKNYSDKNEYVSKIMLNDKPFEGTCLNYTELANKTGMMDGITISFDMNAMPKGRSINVLKMKAMYDSPHPIIIAPIINSTSLFFKNSLTIELNTNSDNCKTYYTTDGTTPTIKSTAYTAPITITEITTIKAISINANGEQSGVSTGTFYKMPHPDWKLTLKSVYNKQYTAGGNDGIIDGMHGTTNWRTGSWQGYQSQDFECVIDLGKEKSFQTITSNYLQDTRAWIIFPKQVAYFVSNDGVTFTPFGISKNTIPTDDYATQLHEFIITNSSTTNARYIKVKATNYGVLPEWHQGKGGDAFIFIDEIDVR